MSSPLRHALLPLLLLAGAVSGCQPASPVRPAATPAEPATTMPAPVVRTPSPAAPRAPDTEPPEFSGMLDEHNAWRAEVGAPPLTWSSRAADAAQQWADQLQREGCAIRHNLDPVRRETYGENIYGYWQTRPYADYRREARFVTDSWAAEKADYDASSNRCLAPPGGTCGHYTQLVWSRSREVGCGRAHCARGEVWVCEYAPRGNYVGVRPFALTAGTVPATAADAQAPEPAYSATATPADLPSTP
ncbi:MAG: hypothetical protein E6R07_02550 [Nevskiaceae bacterium]|nr:MAG: hypothetical protein E6R07_02550 [Nevskiaceae bacterium]